MKTNNITKFREHLDEVYKPGTPERAEFDAGYEEFKIGVMIHDAGKLSTALETAGFVQINLYKKENWLAISAKFA